MNTKNPLPSPDERPGAAVVIYDGQCRFCTQQIRRLAGWDHRGRLAYLSLHDERVTGVLPDLTHEQLMEQMYVVDPQGHRHAGAAGFRYLSRTLPVLWPLAPLMYIPGSLPLWQWAYRQVAKRRYRLAGRVEGCDGDACSVHFR